MFLKKSLSLVSAILILLFINSSSVMAARDQVIQIKGTGAFTLGSMNLTIDQDVLNSILASGGSAGDYQTGLNDNGQLLYMHALLKNPNDAFTFDLDVPDDSDIYGVAAGQTYTYTGIVMYPTTTDNSRSNYTIFGSDTLPHMQSAGEAPIFADATTKYPLIIYAHGAGDRADEFTNLEIVSEIASHGYIVVSLYHGDDRFDLLSAERFNLRPLAVKSAIDTITTHADFKDNINLDQIGGIGGSFGGATMLALAGGKILYANASSTFDFTPKATVTDSRLKATAGLFPYMGDSLYPFFGIGGSGTSSVTLPYMAISGTADDIAPISKIRETMTNVPGTKYLIELEDEGHLFSTEGLSEALTWAITYLDALVKQDSTAQDMLINTNSVSGSVNDSVTMENNITSGGTSGSDSFNGTSGLLTLPAVDVPGSGVLSVTMDLTDADNLIFTLGSFTTASSTASSSFSTTSGLLNIPSLAIDLGTGGSQAWAADLQFLPGTDPMQFKVLLAEPIP